MEKSSIGETKAMKVTKTVTRKGRERRGWTVVFSLMALLLALASCKPAKVTEKPLDSQKAGTSAGTVAQGSQAPHPEAAGTMPAVSRKNEAALLVYKHTGFGYQDSHGYDTSIFRILAHPTGQISGAVMYARMPSEEAQKTTFNVSYVGDQIVVAASGDGTSWSAELTAKKEQLDVKGKVNYSIATGTSLDFISPDGSYVERYSIDTAASELTSEIKKGGAVEEKGKWSFPEKKKAFYAQTRPQDEQNTEGFTIDFWFEDSGDVRFRTEGPAPVNEAYASGLSGLLASEHGLANAAILDLMLGESRYLRPVYALLMSRKGTGK